MSLGVVAPSELEGRIGSRRTCGQIATPAAKKHKRWKPWSFSAQNSFFHGRHRFLWGHDSTRWKVCAGVVWFGFICFGHRIFRRLAVGSVVLKTSKMPQEKHSWNSANDPERAKHVSLAEDLCNMLPRQGCINHWRGIKKQKQNKKPKLCRSKEVVRLSKFSS